MVDYLWLVSSITGTLVLLGAGWRVIVNLVHTRDAIADNTKQNLRLQGEMKEISRELAEVRSELSPDSGASLRDAVDRIELRVDVLDARMIRVERRTETV